MQILKFGGVSIATPDRMKSLMKIIASYNLEKLVIIISAIGKTTNALEQVAECYFKDREKARELLEKIEHDHYAYCNELFINPKPIKDIINNHFVEIYWILEDEPMDSFEYIYDQVVSIGELASSSIFNFLLNQEGFQSKWIDVRGVISTTSNFTRADVNWDKTESKINKELTFSDYSIAVCQGFIGGTDDNETTTLGREGSDFSGAIFANCLNATNYTIYKDVDGVLNADPKQYENTVVMRFLTYKEAVEMTYYGAKVIHPKTIKPLQNKAIPLQVKSFLNLDEDGTTINESAEMIFEQPIKILKESQVLLTLNTLSLDFFDEEQMTKVLALFNTNETTINLMQKGAVQCSFLINESKLDIEKLIQQLKESYSINRKSNLKLATLRHYNALAINELVKDKTIILEQKTPKNYQIVYT